MMSQYLHPNDYPLFVEVTTAMRVVARKYKLPLRSIEPHPKPEYRTSPLGDCSPGGDIRLVLRGMKNGEWDDTPRARDEVFRTAGHELAHLKHMNHGLEFHQFEEEMWAALRNEEEDPKQKIISKIIKLRTQSDSEAKIGNAEAAQSFAAMVNKMLIEHELNPTDIDYARGTADDPIIEMTADLEKFGIQRSSVRIAWQQDLAVIVANANLCQILVRPSSNSVTFVGTKTHATLAEYAYGTLVPAALLLSDKEAYYYRLECRRNGEPKKANGFREAWLVSFVQRIGQRMKEARQDAVVAYQAKMAAAGEAVPADMAMIRLSGAMKRVQQHIDNRWSRKRKYANPLNGGSANHAEGRARGRAAADAMHIGRKGVGSSAPKLLV